MLVWSIYIVKFIGIKVLIMSTFIYFFCFLYSVIHMCIHWAISLSRDPPLAPPQPAPPTLLASRQNLFCPLLQFCWRENISDNKKDILFLLVWDKSTFIFLMFIVSIVIFHVSTCDSRNLCAFFSLGHSY
jgi:hypothetical protein